MPVTDKDVLVANYAVKSYKKIYGLKSKWGGANFILYIYANCLSQKAKDKYFPIWNSYSYVEIYDNTEKVKGLYLEYGQRPQSPEGVQGFRGGNRETGGEIWSSELRKIRTDYYATVDADFEILHVDFYLKMMEELSQNENLVVYATDYSPTAIVFDSYSNDTIAQSERWHTWFCIYKRKAQKCETSHFYYEFIMPNKMRFVYDDAAYYQYHLKEKHGYDLRALTAFSHYHRGYIHYGAFAKNRSIDENNVALYRYLSIKAVTGFTYSEPWRKFFPIKVLNFLYRRIASFLLYKIYRSHIEERRYYSPP